MIAILAHNLIIIIIFMTIILAKSTLFHHSSVSSEIGEKVAIFDKLMIYIIILRIKKKN